MRQPVRVVRIHETGAPDVLQIDAVDLEPPRAGEAQVEHRAVGLNFIDVYHRSGLYKLPSLPAGLGMEAAGVVTAVGEDVTDVRVGQRVAYAGGPPGAYAEARNIAADRLVPLPDDVDDETAAAAMLKGMTVEYLIRRTRPVRAGDTVLWHAAAGGVGLIACQWLRHLGVTMIGTVGSREKAERARLHGCAHTIVYTEENFVERVREITQGRGVPVVFDSVGEATFAGSLDCLSPRGMYVGFGNASGKPEPFDMAILAQKGSLYLTRPTLMAYTESREDLLGSAEALFSMLRGGELRIEVQQRWPLARVADAHRALQARQTTGSSVIVV